MADSLENGPLVVLVDGSNQARVSRATFPTRRFFVVQGSPSDPPTAGPYAVFVPSGLWSLFLVSNQTDSEVRVQVEGQLSPAATVARGAIQMLVSDGADAMLASTQAATRVDETSLDHNLLSGLTRGNPHPQYVLQAQFAQAITALQAEAPTPVAAESSGDATSLGGRSPDFYLSRSNHYGTIDSRLLAPQGAGSGLDADTLRGYVPEDFALAADFADLKGKLQTVASWNAGFSGTFVDHALGRHTDVDTEGATVGQALVLRSDGKWAPGTVTPGGGVVQSIRADANPQLTGHITLAAGSNITLTQVGQTITIDATSASYTDEQAQDAVGGILVDSATINFSYNDGVPSITADTIPAGILAQLLTVDGAGSGLDADLLDGLDSTAFALAAHGHDAVYLRLDATNDPLTGGLAIQGSVASDPQLYVEGAAAQTEAIQQWAYDGGQVFLQVNANGDLNFMDTVNIVNVQSIDSAGALDISSASTGDLRFHTDFGMVALFASDTGDFSVEGHNIKNVDAVMGGGATAGTLKLAPDDTGVIASGGVRQIVIDSTFTQNNSGIWSGLTALADVSMTYIVDATDAAPTMQGYEFGSQVGGNSKIEIQNAGVNPVSAFIFANRQTYQATQVGTTNLILTGSFLDQPSLHVEGGGDMFGIYYGVQSAPAFTGDNVSTGSIGVAHFTSSLPAISSDWDIFERRGFVMKQAITSGGTVGIETGIWLEGFIGTGTRITLHSLDSSAWMQHAGKARFGADTAPSATLDVTGTGAFSGVVTSTVSTGTAPFTIASTTVNTNLNADMVDGFHAASFQPIDATLTALAALADTAGVLTNDGAGGLSWVAGGGSYTDENAQDAVGTILVDSATIDFTYSDATPSITATVIQSALDHGSIGGLSDDDHSIYALLAGRAGGQTIKGGTAAGDDLTLVATAGAGVGSEQIIFKGGNNGATTLAVLDSGGLDVNGITTFADGGATVTLTPSSVNSSILATTKTRLRLSSAARNIELSNADFSSNGDNDVTLGGASNRWQAIFVGTTTSTFDCITQHTDRIELRNAKELRFYESGSGNYSQFKAGTQSADVTYTLPTGDAANAQYGLSSDAAGTLSWAKYVGPFEDTTTGTAAGTSVASATDVECANAAVVKANTTGAVPVCVSAMAEVTNSSGGARTYSWSIYKKVGAGAASSVASGTAVASQANGSLCLYPIHYVDSVSAANTYTYSIRIHTSNTSGTQTANSWITVQLENP